MVLESVKIGATPDVSLVDIVKTTAEIQCIAAKRISDIQGALRDTENVPLSEKIETKLVTDRTKMIEGLAA